MFSVQLDYWNLLENRRKNLAQEEETRRSNKEKEAETRRHNQEDEMARRNELSARYAELTERIRSDLANESINSRNVDTREVGNKIQSDYNANVILLRQGELAESQRSNLAREAQTQYLLPSERFRNYASGASSIGSTISDVGNLLKNWIGTGASKVANTQGFSNVLNNSTIENIENLKTLIVNSSK